MLPSLPTDVIKSIVNLLDLYEQSSLRLVCKSFAKMNFEDNEHSWVLQDFLAHTTPFTFDKWDKRLSTLSNFKPFVNKIHIHIENPYSHYFPFGFTSSIEFSYMLRVINRWLLSDPNRSCHIYGVYFRTIWVNHILTECPNTIHQLYLSGSYESYTLENITTLKQLNIKNIVLHIGNIDLLNHINVESIGVVSNMESLIDLSTVPKHINISVHAQNSFADIRFINPSNIVHISISSTLNMGIYYRNIHHLLEKTDFPKLESIGIGELSMNYDFKYLFEYLRSFLKKCHRSYLDIERVEDPKSIYIISQLRDLHHRIRIICNMEFQIILACIISQLFKSNIHIQTISPLRKYVYLYMKKNTNELFHMLPDNIKPSWALTCFIV
jgi:hypothetical protein